MNTRHSLTGTLVLALTLSLPVTNAVAASPESSPVKPTKSPTAKKLSPVEVIGQAPQRYLPSLVSAIKSGAALKDTPQTITVITDGLIRDQAMRNMADVVQYVPGVGMAQGEGNRDTPIFRGNSTTADMFIDGMRDDVQYFRDLYNIESVEVLTGPNAMLFGRGGSGGLLNRVSKQANWTNQRAASVQLGSWNKRRGTVDINQAFNEKTAARVTALSERDESFRNDYQARRWGINPTLTLRANDSTTLHFSAERFHDERTADRGVPSLDGQGRPRGGDRSSFFGDPDRSDTWADVEAVNLGFEYRPSEQVSLSNRTRLADYDKFYQNVFAGGPIKADGNVKISAYNNATRRQNLFNQTDLVLNLDTGRLHHTVLLGAELGRQETDNFRNTGFFTAAPLTSHSPTSAIIDARHPIYTGPIQFAQNATDADNHSVATVASGYAQDQIAFSSQWQAVLGLRFDRFNIDLDNHRTDSALESRDHLLSPRTGLIYQPNKQLSWYSSYSVAYLPRSGDQLSSLTVSNQALDPEEFENLELGLKWQINTNLTASAAAYRLDRSNVAVVDPADSSRLILLSGPSQRVRGIELGISGQLSEHWSVMGGAAWQDAEILRDIRTSSTALLRAGTVLAQVPERSASFWNRYDFNPTWGVGLGAIYRSKVFTSTSNAVTLPAYTRFDAAVYWAVSQQVQVQLNVENLFDHHYFASANGDNNISPGSPRALTLGVNLSF